MGESTGIEWTDATWNPWQGCHKISPGCKNCYMFQEKERFGSDGNRVVRSSQRTFGLPLRLRKIARVFTCSWSDFFIEEADPWRDEAWNVIARTPHLTYQILTKRPERMAGRLPWGTADLPWPNVWLGISAESQISLQVRLPVLVATPAAVRFVSAEPLLAFLDFAAVDGSWPAAIDWVIVGGESGRGARAMHLAWAIDVVSQCRHARVACFVKQLGAGFGLRDPKGGDMSEWPPEVRMREFPKARHL